MKEKKALCICASNMRDSGEEGTSWHICKILEENLRKKKVATEVVDLREISLAPCMGCGRCCVERRCVEDTDFNRIYNKMEESDYLFFVSPHYAPVPAKLCMILEKIEQLTFLRQWNAPSYQSELCGKLAGIISHGGGGERKLMDYKAMVNDTIADALKAAQLKVVPFNSKWNTGISFAAMAQFQENEIFPVLKYDWKQVEERVRMYVEIVVQTSRTLYAIL